MINILTNIATLSLTAIVASLLATTAAIAQLPLEADDTLGSENSQVIDLGGNNFVIGGGAPRGSNLFHSFREFNVNEGGSVFFQNPASIETILSRVTGGNPSQILGILGVIGDANLFLLNPNGIVFGPNASLNIGGSFVATTANAMQFGDQGFFSATTPELPSPLLTIQPSAFLFNQIPVGNIVNTSIAPAGNNAFGNIALGLRVPDGHSLVLLGGNVVLDGSQSIVPGGGGVNALGGRIELGGLTEAGGVGLGIDGDRFTLNLPQATARADVSIINGARVDVVSGNGGDIAINARNIEIASGSTLFAGIGSGLGDLDALSGDINLDATGDFRLADSSSIANVLSGGVGNTGGIRVLAGNVRLINGSVIATVSGGLGNAGNITIEATDTISLVGQNEGGVSSQIFSTVASIADLGFPEFIGVGDGGDVQLRAREITLADGTQIGTTTFFAQANAGNIQISATESLILRNTSAIQALTSGQGNAGNIEISTTTLDVLTGSQLQTSTLAEGSAGNIRINASDRVTFSGTSADGQFSSAVFSAVNPGAVGNGGSIDITTGILEVLDGAQLNASTSGEGNAGRIRIVASVRVTFGGISADGQLRSAVFSTVNPGAVGNGDGINITTGILEVLDGAQLNASTSGEGNAGNIQIEARDRVTLSGTSADGQLRSVVFNTVNPGAVGNGGGIDITAGSLEVLDGASLNASTASSGNAGSIRIVASDRVTFSGTSSIFSRVESGAIGNGGDIDITTGSLEALDGAQLIASTFSEGDAGRIRIAASDRVTFSGISVDGEFNSIAFSTVEPGAIGNGGDINISTNVLELLDGAQLVASTLGRGNAGRILIEARDRVTFSGISVNEQLPSAAFSTVEPGATGNGGSIDITTGVLELLEGGALSASTGANGDAGDITIDARESVLVSGAGDLLSGGIFSSSGGEATGEGGSITINSPQFTLSRGAVVDAETETRFPGGSITITVDSLNLLDGGQVITTTAGSGQAGTITITVNGRALFQGVDATFGDRLAVFTLESPAEEFFNVENGESGLFANTRPGSSGDGGMITLQAGILDVEAGARILASTQGTGNAGSLNLTVGQMNLQNEAEITVSSTGSSLAGGIALDANTVSLRDQSIISAETEAGSGGNITLRIVDNLRLQGGSRISASTGDGEGGRLIVNRDREPVGSINLNTGSAITTAASGSGDAGRIGLNAESLTLSDRSTISASTQSGVGGDITLRGLTTSRVSESEISASTNTGQAGSLQIEAIDSILLTGGGGLSVEATDQSGIAGNLGIRTGTLSVEDGSTVSVRSLQGRAGNLTVEAREVTLDQGQLTAATSQSGEEAGATITLQDLKTLFMQNGSLISARALEDADGGNVTIDATDGFVIGIPNENSDIIATAEVGDGGNITIRANRIFGFIDQTEAGLTFDELRDNRTSDISASSEFGAQGTVVQDVLAVDPTQGLTELPGNLVDASDQVGQVCPSGPGVSESLGRFVITGRGGIAPGPLGSLESDRVDAEWVESEAAAGEAEPTSETPTVAPLREAQAWVVGEDGRVHLVAGDLDMTVGPEAELPVCP
jgi:filamentous hemagglutinin family protein